MQLSAKKNDIKCMATLLMLFMLVASLAGCGGATTAPTDTTGETPTASTGTTPVETSVPSTEASTYGEGEWRTFDPPITATWGFPHDINDDTFAAMAEAGEPYDNNRWIELYRDKVGVDVKYEMVAPNSADYNQNLVLAMSSGDLPDVFYTTDLGIYNQMCEAGVLADLTEIYAKEANPTMKGIVEGEGSSFLNTFMYDGKLYGIPGKMPSTNGYNYLWVRKDWLDKLNMPVPNTMAEVKAVAQAFKDKDPDGNGKNDTLGLLIDSAYKASSATGIFWAYEGKASNDNYWVTHDDGKVGFSLIQPEMKGGLNFLQDMYTSGLINQEFSTVRIWDTAVSSTIANNTCGLFYGHHWYSIWIDSAKDQMSEGFEWIPILPPTESGAPSKVYASIDFAGVYCVNAEYKNPEALVAMFNCYDEKLFGKDNDFSNYFASEINGTLWQSGPIHMLSADVDIIPHREMKEAKAKGTLDSLTGVGGDYWKFIQSGLTQYDYMFGPENSCFSLVDATYPDIMVWNGFRGAPTSTQAERWSSMQEIIDTTYLKIIYGELGVDEGFDKMVTDWNAAGGQQVTDEVNAIVASYK